MTFKLLFSGLSVLAVAGTAAALSGTNVLNLNKQNTDVNSSETKATNKEDLSQQQTIDVPANTTLKNDTVTEKETQTRAIVEKYSSISNVSLRSALVRLETNNWSLDAISNELLQSVFDNLDESLTYLTIDFFNNLKAKEKVISNPSNFTHCYLSIKSANNTSYNIPITKLKTPKKQSSLIFKMKKESSNKYLVSFDGTQFVSSANLTDDKKAVSSENLDDLINAFKTHAAKETYTANNKQNKNASSSSKIKYFDAPSYLKILEIYKKITTRITELNSSEFTSVNNNDVVVFEFSQSANNCHAQTPKAK